MLEVLIVDDSPAIRASVALILKAANITAVEASSAEDALAKLKAGGVKPGLCIVDLNMPGMDGISLIKQIRTMPNTRFTPILMLTTESQQTKRQEAKAAGATGWLVKPISPADLMRTVKQVCPNA
jgi:two-component system, chemotaxis family, chemotaxis protein CheY